ncbi:MAG: RluA family pseudouridine synthase [Nitrospiraceae bacterium]|nr:RluA family pseudouridine synthase [Nitrospiraceae bacterium]
MKFTTKKEGVLLDILLDKLGASRTKTRMLIKKGGVLIDGRPTAGTDESLPLPPGRVIEISGKKQRHQKLKIPPPFPVLFEDEHLIALEKPAGLLSIGTETEKVNTFYRAVSRYVKENSGGRQKIFIVHRLDREVSGVMLFAKSEEVKRALQEGWEKTLKHYNALVEGRPPRDEGTIEGWLCARGVSLMRSCPASSAEARRAVTHYRIIRAGRRFSLLEIRLETGRKHQIRVHLSEAGCPVVGDSKYGFKGKNPLRRMGLHAARLVFYHPVTGQRITLESPMPRSFLLPFKTEK